jgi:hypothetical protein
LTYPQSSLEAVLDAQSRKQMLQRIDPPIGVVRCTDRIENAHKEAAFVGAGRHLQDNNRPRLCAGGFVMMGRMHAFELLDDHRLSHATVAIEQEAWHARAAGLLDEFIYALQRPRRAPIADPIRSPHLADPVLIGVERPFSNRAGQ